MLNKSNICCVLFIYKIFNNMLTLTKRILKYLTWTEVLSCSPHSFHQTLWTSSGYKHESSHTSRTWCFERLQAFLVSILSTGEKANRYTIISAAEMADIGSTVHMCVIFGITYIVVELNYSVFSFWSCVFLSMW